MSPTLLPYGDRAWLIETDDAPARLAQWLRAQTWPAGTEVVAGARTCLLRFAGPAPAMAEIRGLLSGAAALSEHRGTEAAPVILPVRYDGEDLGTVAEAVGMSRDAVIAQHAAATYRVAFLGFAPGFAYLTGLPLPLHLPRRDVPRVRVPAGAVAIADEYTAVYPRPSPGGWHLLGRCDEWLFDPDRRPPSRLRSGLRVRFEAVG